MDLDEENYLQLYSEIPVDIQEPEGISNLEYSPTGELFSYTTDSSLKIHSCSSLNLRNIISVKIGTMKYFQNNTLLHTKDNTILYLSIYDNRHMRKFENHTDNIKSFSVSPANDTFMSVGTEKVNMWDIRYKNPIFSIDSNGKLGATNGDHEYALADNNFIYLFDWRNDKGPLAIKSIKPGFYQKMWYTGYSSTICLSNFKDHVFLDTEGNYISTFSLENSCDPDVINESNMLICASSSYIFSYKILDKKIIGRSSIPNYQCNTVRVNPMHHQFIFASETQLKFWKMI